MEIIPIGVGGAFAKTLYQTNFLVRPDEGDPFLIDCGHTAPRALRELGIELEAASTVILSHLHADHIGGLEELGFTGYFAWGKKPILNVPEQLVDVLWENALKAGMGQRLKLAHGKFENARLDTYFDVRPFNTSDELNFGSVTVTPFRTPHVPGRPSWGYRLTETKTGGSAMLTCDSRFKKANMEKYGRGADKIFHDCQLSTNGDTIHTLLSELTTLDEEWQKKIILVHYGDNWKEYEDETGLTEFGVQGKAYKF